MLVSACPHQGQRRKEVSPDDHAVFVNEIDRNESRGFLEYEAFGRRATRHDPLPRE